MGFVQAGSLQNSFSFVLIGVLKLGAYLWNTVTIGSEHIFLLATLVRVTTLHALVPIGRPYK